MVVVVVVVAVVAAVAAVVVVEMNATVARSRAVTVMTVTISQHHYLRKYSKSRPSLVQSLPVRAMQQMGSMWIGGYLY